MTPKTTTRRALLAAAAFAAFAAASSAQAADAWPSKPIHLIIGYAAGGPTDVAARYYARFLSEALGQTVVVDNRAGASGVVAASVTKNAQPDGYTLYYVASPTMTMTPLIQQSSNFKPLEDFSFIEILYDFANVLLVSQNAKVQNVGDLIAQARSQPNSVSYGSAGIGATNHLSGELLAQMAGVKMLHIPYKGNAPALSDVMGGKISFMFDVSGTAIMQIQGGKVRALAVSSPERMPQLPDVPAVSESGLKDFSVTGWYGLIGPKGLPKEIVSRINQANAAIAQNPEYKKWMYQYGYNIQTTGPDTMRERTRNETVLWEGVIKKANIHAE
ncbi:MAG: tripartite tricarboxylate transporter substrate binding protein [Burkholderiaceae bacterium]|jgi:tripartite-type tricarboxylate transporter receptor subunit TctC|nr:tripartite tricarboxylate transporter substrate binding protein [Burkholderiaceae bacterium]